MGLGRAVGYTLLALLDAVVPAGFVLAAAGTILVGFDIGGVDGWVIALVAGGLTYVFTLLASGVSHVRGGKPFAFTRMVKRAYASRYGPPWMWP